MDKKLEDLESRCLDQALAVLETETTLTVAAVRVVERLTCIAIVIEQLDLRRAEQNRYGAAVFRDRP